MHNEPFWCPRLCFSDGNPLRALTLTLTQLTGRETLSRRVCHLLELANPTHTLGEARQTVIVHNGVSHHDVGGLCVGAVDTPFGHVTELIPHHPSTSILRSSSILACP